VNDRLPTCVRPEPALLRMPAAESAVGATAERHSGTEAMTGHRDVGGAPPGVLHSDPVRVILGEPASNFRTSLVADLARRPELEVVAVGTSAGMVRACASRQPDVALVADDLPLEGGVRTIERLVAAAPEVLVVMWTDTPDGDARTTLFLIADNMERIRSRVRQLLGKSAWAENPPSRTRRLISNVRIREKEGDTICVTANFVVYRMRFELVDTYVGRYEYTLVWRDGTLKIRHRRAILDLEALRPHGKVSIIL